MKLRLSLLMLLCLFTLSTLVARADTVNFAINGNASPRPDGSWQVPNVGFVVTSPNTFSLTGIQTNFAVLSHPAFNVNRVVTVGLWTHNPSFGGMLLAIGTFESSTAVGQFGGATFSSPVPIVAGQSYFVGFLNVTELGLNLTNEAGAISLPHFFSLPSDPPLSFSRTAGNGLQQPILRFLQADPIPEPATILLLGTGLAGVVGAARTQLKTKGRRRPQSLFDA